MAGEPTVRVSGTGGQASAPFRLAGGDYVVTWTAACDEAAGWQPGDPSVTHDHELWVRSTEGATRFPLVHTLIAGSVPVANLEGPPGPPGPGPAALAGVPAGSYVVEGATDCAWELDFTPR